jgi:hypothetical protein
MAAGNFSAQNLQRVPFAGVGADKTSSPMPATEPAHVSALSTISVPSGVATRGGSFFLDINAGFAIDIEGNILSTIIIFQTSHAQA